jgi:hypothetical protein
MFFAFVPYHLDLKPAATWSAALVWHYQNSATAFDRVEEDLATFKLVASRDGQYEVSVSRKLLRTRLPGVVVDAPKNAKPDEATTNVYPDRLLGLPAWGSDRDAARLGRLFDFEAIRTVEAYTLALNQPKLPKAIMVIEEDAPSETLRSWHWTLRELSGSAPIAAEGELWTRKSDGIPVRMHLEADNVPLPEGQGTGQLTLDLGPAPGRQSSSSK